MPAQFRLRHHGHDMRLTGEAAFTVGRGQDCDLTIDDHAMSRQHARLSVVMDSVWIEDLESRNGVKVNGTRIHSPTQLNHADKLEVGSQSFVLIDLSELRKRRTQSTDDRTQDLRTRMQQVRSENVYDMLIRTGRGALDENNIAYARQLGEHLFHSLHSPPKDAPEPTEDTHRATAEFAGRLATLTKDVTWVERAQEAERNAILGQRKKEKRDPYLGRTLAGSYRLIELIGRGALGQVYRSEQVALRRPVAVKVVHRHLARERAAVDRFSAEARSASLLDHPNCVHAIDFGRTEDGICYMATELLEGPNLATLQEQQAPLPLTRIIRITRGVLNALAEAHARGVIHRDIKPENIIVTRTRSGDDFPKVVDFGLATIVTSASRGLDAQTLMVGTPRYLSPEQAQNETVDERADLYSLGVVLFELLACRPPFEGAEPVDLALAHIFDKPPDVRELAPKNRPVPPELAAIVEKALAKKPQDRYQRAMEMNNALAGLRLDQIRPALSGLVCHACGSALPGPTRFCGICGAPMK